MHKASDILEELMRSFPQERTLLSQYVNRAEAYKNECGCEAGAAALAVSFGFLVAYAVLFNGFGTGNLLIDAFGGLAFAFVASILGKLTAIGIARIRLALLYRHLRVKYKVEGN